MLKIVCSGMVYEEPWRNWAASQCTAYVETGAMCAHQASVCMRPVFADGAECSCLVSGHGDCWVCIDTGPAYVWCGYNEHMEPVACAAGGQGTNIELLGVVSTSTKWRYWRA